MFQRTHVLGNFRLPLSCANLQFPTLETFGMALLGIYFSAIDNACSPGRLRKIGRLFRCRIQAYLVRFDHRQWPFSVLALVSSSGWSGREGAMTRKPLLSGILF